MYCAKGNNFCILTLYIYIYVYIRLQSKQNLLVSRKLHYLQFTTCERLHFLNPINPNENYLNPLSKCRYTFQVSKSGSSYKIAINNTCTHIFFNKHCDTNKHVLSKFSWKYMCINLQIWSKILSIINLKIEHSYNKNHMHRFTQSQHPY